jgi:hypothetical protein
VASPDGPGDRGRLAEVEALAAELVAIRAELAKLHVLVAEPERPLLH